MNEDVKLTDTISIGLPVLLRFARRTYRLAVREALKNGGFDDISNNGTYIINGIANDGPRYSQLIKELGIAKQAASQVTETLVRNGYVTRSTDPDDRRHISITLTAKGKQVAELCQKAIHDIDTELGRRIGEESVRQAKYALATLIDITDARHDLLRGSR